MKNEHHRVTLVTFLIMAIFVHESHFLSEINQLENSSENQQKDSIVIGGLNATDPTEAVHSAWPAVLGALTAVISICVLIAVAVRYRLFRWCLTRSRHSLLLDGETASQFSQAGALEGDVLVRGMRGRMIHTGGSSDEDADDDGFIEDNYIQATMTEKREEEEIQEEDTEDTDDELLTPEMD